MAEQVIIGMDPHKLSVTFEARDSREILRAAGRLGTPRGQTRPGLAFNGPVSILALQQPSIRMSPVRPIRSLAAYCQCGACR